jgi:pimeloyl-ACP methyl ester carboxylesterase
VVLMHRYGADRSWLFNLGVKINETTNFTILWPDLRGHGLTPPVNWTSFGTREGDDVLAALDFLRGLKTQKGEQLVTNSAGLYGVELGSYAALRAAREDQSVQALVLDSVPRDADELVKAAAKNDLGVSIRPLQSLTLAAIRVYFLTRFDNTPTCQVAASLAGRRILLLSGRDAGYLRDSTIQLARCFPQSANVEVKTDLPLTGFNLPSATGEDGERYDRQVIDFFDRMLGKR